MQSHSSLSELMSVLLILAKNDSFLPLLGLLNPPVQLDAMLVPFQ